MVGSEKWKSAFRKSELFFCYSFQRQRPILPFHEMRVPGLDELLIYESPGEMNWISMWKMRFTFIVGSCIHAIRCVHHFRELSELSRHRNFPNVKLCSSCLFRFPFSVLFSFSLFFFSVYGAQTLWHREIYFHKGTKLSIWAKPSYASQGDTALHSGSTPWRVGALTARKSRIKSRKLCNLVDFSFFSAFTHPISPLFLLFESLTISEKSSFHCQPDNANVCCVVAFLSSIRWVRLFSFCWWDEKAADMRDGGEAQQNHPGELPQHLFLYGWGSRGDPWKLWVQHERKLDV